MVHPKVGGTSSGKKQTSARATHYKGIKVFSQVSCFLVENFWSSQFFIEITCL